MRRAIFIVVGLMLLAVAIHIVLRPRAPEPQKNFLYTDGTPWGNAPLRRPASNSQASQCQEASQTQRNVAASMITLQGYECKKVDAMCPYVLYQGWTVYCNDYRYSFELKKHGDQWSVTAN